MHCQLEGAFASVVLRLDSLMVVGLSVQQLDGAASRLGEVAPESRSDMWPPGHGEWERSR